MPIVTIHLNEQQPNDDELWEALSTLASDEDSRRVVMTMIRLMRERQLALWVSPRLMRKLKAFAAQHQEGSRPVSGKVDDTLFVLWLQQGGSMEPNLQWEVEALPDNGGIYRILLEGGQHEEGIHYNQGE